MLESSLAVALPLKGEPDLEHCGDFHKDTEPRITTIAILAGVCYYAMPCTQPP